MISSFEKYADYLKPFYDAKIQVPGEEREDFQRILDILDNFFLWVSGVVDVTREWGGKNKEWKILSETIKRSYVDPKVESNFAHAWSTVRNILKIFNNAKEEEINYSYDPIPSPK